MQKVLICASSTSHINNFHLPYLKYFKEQGLEVHVAVPEPAALEYADYNHDIPMSKHILSPKNLLAIRKLSGVMKENDFDLICTHTSLAALVGRAAVWLVGKKKAKVINTVHGYLFWNGCGFLRRTLYYLPERLLRGVTDCVIVMNGEDAVTARKLVKKGGLVVKVPGMGVDPDRFAPPSGEEKRAARRALAIPDSAFVLGYAAEFSKRKNHAELLEALSKIKNAVPDVLLLLCGTGALRDKIESEAKRLELSGSIRFMGWCGQMEKIYAACDLAVSTSRSEGLPFNIMEAQLCAVPVVASRIRGHSDLITNGLNGWLYPPGSPGELAEAVVRIYGSPDRGQKQGTAASASAKKYSLAAAFEANTAVYRKMLPTAGPRGPGQAPGTGPDKAVFARSAGMSADA
ncbi:MAG: glycosyltransferase family 4 protein [Oscillospiraceae bacterium]